MIVAETGTREIRDNWRLILAAMVGTGVGMPTLPFYTVGIYAPVLAREFHWPSSVIFGGLSIALVGLLVTGPIMGAVTDRVGARRVAAISLVGLALSYMSLAASTGSVLQWDLSWLAIAITGAGATPMGFTRAISATIVRRRGMALGITLAGSGLFVLLIKPLALAGVGALGWRETILAVGLLPLVIGVPLTLWGLPRQEAGTVPAVGKAARLPIAAALALAFRKRAFWILLLSFAAISFGSAAPFSHLDNVLRSLQVPAASVIRIASFTGAALILGRLITGWVMDRVWAPAVALVMLLAAAGASLLLSAGSATPVMAGLAAGLLGLAAGAEIDLLAFLTARFVGVRTYGVVYGALYGVFGIGAGLGPLLIGLLVDRTGNYSLVMTVCAGMLALAALMLLTLGRYPNQAETDPSADTSPSLPLPHAAA